MDIEKRSTKIGAAIILFGVLLRLLSGTLAAEGSAFALPELKDVQIQMEGGSIFRGNGGFAAVPVTSAPPQPTQPAPTLPPEPVLPVFSGDAAADIRFRNDSSLKKLPDLAALLSRSLSWDLDSGEPTVLIVHSHGSESYTKVAGQNYEESSAYRTLNRDYNMVSIGDELTRLLEAGGITVIHDRQMHDVPEYGDSYTMARKSIQSYLRQYPTIRVVLDLHRDAALNADGSQYATAAVVNGERAAQLMLVMGSNASGNSHPNWQENLALALKLQVLLEESCPGITRPISLRSQRFNQDLAAGAMIVEVGTAGNTRQEALRAMPVLAEAIIALANGANPVT